MSWWIQEDNIEPYVFDIQTLRLEPKYVPVSAKHDSFNIEFGTFRFYQIKGWDYADPEDPPTLINASDTEQLHPDNIPLLKRIVGDAVNLDALINRAIGSPIIRILDYAKYWNLVNDKSVANHWMVAGRELLGVTDKVRLEKYAKKKNWN